MSKKNRNFKGRAVLDAKTPEATQLRDGLINALTGLGTSYDRAAASKYVPGAPLKDVEIEALYRENWMAAKAIDIPAEDMVRAWREFSGVDSEQIKKIDTEEKRLCLVSKVCSAVKWGDLYGGEAIGVI